MTDFRTVPRKRNRLGKEQQNEIEFRISQADVHAEAQSPFRGKPRRQLQYET
jgi:hypothetical protein